MTLRPKAILYFLVVFFAGALTSTAFEWLHPLTSVRITNASGKVIKSLDISYRGFGEHQGRIAKNLQPGKTIYFKWVNEGEADYWLHAIFDDGTEVKGGAGYLERGDVIKESIEAERVMSERPMLFTFSLLFHPPWDTTDREDDKKPSL